MTRWAMIADLRRCVGCQTCTAACKHANATSPAVQWRKVLDMEAGIFPEVERAFVPVGCMHCADPPCMHVCPSTATRQRADGIVTIDYDICIGCAYCAVACPYQARYKVDAPRFAYGRASRMAHEAVREQPRRVGVAQKCTFCTDRIDPGLDRGLTPGINPEATPACVNSCIADALHFGDLDDAESNVSALLRDNKHFRMHEELETESGFYYLWEAGPNGTRRIPAYAPSGEPLRPVVGGPQPWLQRHWDWRAAANFICGGTGGGLLAVATAGLVGFGTPLAPFALTAAAFVAAGLFFVWLETGRPLRAPFQVFRHPQTSWMTRESMVAVMLLPTALAAAWLGWRDLAGPLAILALAFLYCQGRMLTEAKAIPAWREPMTATLIVSTALAEGAGVYLIAATLLVPEDVPAPAALAVLILMVLARAGAWAAYRWQLTSAPTLALDVLGRFAPWLILGGTALPAALALAALFLNGMPVVALLAALTAVLGGWALKFVLITRAAYNQGFAVEHMPERGTGVGGGPGVKPGWA